MDKSEALLLLKAEREKRKRERASEYSSYRADPVGYARRVIGATLTGAQEEGLEALATGRRVAFKASHAIGKTFMAAVAACWWYDCWPEHIVYITAPTWGQALGLTFKQIKLLRRNLDLPGIIRETGQVVDGDRVAAAGHFIRAINADTGEGFQGEHTAPILVIMEEAVGVPAHIWAASGGLMTHPDCKILAIANPTDESTPFGMACADGLHRVVTASVLDHPNVAAELQCRPPPFPNAVRLLWLQEMLEVECQAVGAAEGETFEFHSVPTIKAALAGLPASTNPDAETWHYLPNAIFQGRALGEFPSQAAEHVVPKGWLDRCRPLPDDGTTPEVGVDVARYGTDRTTIASRAGGVVLGLAAVRQMSLEAVTGAVILEVRKLADSRRINERTVPVRVDVTGGLGAGPADSLAAQGYAVEPVNSSERAVAEQDFPNRRSELWFATRERARTRDLDLSRLDPRTRSDLVRELTTPKWKPDSKGRKVVEPKSDTKKRLGCSPDLADALNLAFAPSRPLQSGAVVLGGRRPAFRP